jgi:NAD(P)-dependent dehydrogenase (short-subunit alcohol dehydrogenase family)
MDIQVSQRVCPSVEKPPLTVTVVVAAKTVSDLSSATAPFRPDPNSPQSTITTVAREIRAAGGAATALQVDTRDEASVARLVDETVRTHGRLDVLVYNAGAIWWAPVARTPTARFRLMQRVNAEGLYAAVQAALPHFERGGWAARVVVVSPPIYSRFFRGKTAYAMGKVAMSVLTKGLAMDWEREGRAGMAITSLWPAAAIESAATQNPQTDRSELRSAVPWVAFPFFSDANAARPSFRTQYWRFWTPPRRK